MRTFIIAALVGAWLLAAAGESQARCGRGGRGLFRNRQGRIHLFHRHDRAGVCSTCH